MSLRWTLIAPVYDRFTHKTEEGGVRELREGLLADATGRVLEIGGGTGLNLPFYDGADSLVVTEPEAAMLRRLQAKAHEQAQQAELVQAPAEDLPFEDASFDVVVSTLVLCGADQKRSLGEVRRVLRPGGRLLFLEHVRSDDPDLAALPGPDELAEPLRRRLQLQPADARGNRGRRASRSRVEHTTLPEAPKFTRPLIVGTAVAPS